LFFRITRDFSQKTSLSLKYFLKKEIF